MAGIAFHKYDRFEKRDIRLNKDYILPVWDIDIGKTNIRFAHASRVSEKRARLFTSKEPTTLIWIDGFQSTDVLTDVGANVGSYSVWAAKRRGCRVISCEPESLNYAELNKNIHINGVQHLVRAFCVGISDTPDITDLYLSRFVPSFSHHDVGEARWEGPVTNLATSAGERHRQGIIAVRLDWLLPQLPSMKYDHLKIDVDGLEHKVIKGAEKILDRYKTILLECDFTISHTEDMVQYMLSRGWRFSYDQVCFNREGWMTPDQWEETRKNKAGGSNIIFYKDQQYDSWWKDAMEPYKGFKP